MTMFYAKPYDLSATGIYFEDFGSFEAKMSIARNDYGEPVEEFEIQFIEGQAIDAALCKAIGIHQNTVEQVLKLLETLDDQDKQCLIIACGECGYSFDPESGDVRDFDLDNFQLTTKCTVGTAIRGTTPNRLNRR